MAKKQRTKEDKDKVLPDSILTDEGVLYDLDELTSEIDTPEAKGSQVKEVDAYTISMGGVPLQVTVSDADDYVLHYNILTPKIDFATRVLLDEVKQTLIGGVQIEVSDVLDPNKLEELNNKFLDKAQERLKEILQQASDADINVFSRILINEMMGLGELEYLLADDGLEEVVVNSSKDVIWIYHKKHGWVKTNIKIPSEEQIRNYSARVARQVGREITNLEPLLDAHLVTGDRVNATLFPISSDGNTITIRRFSRTPWTMVHMIDPKFKTISPEVAAFLWLCVEYELSILVAGGTASGKTSILNALMPFMPPNQRIISMEDTRELNLPGYLHWVPLTTRPPNPHGEGEVSMLDLVQNSLRMRPDRIIVGEVRRKREAEVLFEAMHTGHSVYGTFHAETGQEVVDRITSPPMNIPGLVFQSLHLVLIQYRNRRTGIRRTFELSEIVKSDETTPKLNTVYHLDPRTDEVQRVNPSVRVLNELRMFTGMSKKDMEINISERQQILLWLLEQNIKDVDDVGKIIAEYYRDKESTLELISYEKNI